MARREHEIAELERMSASSLVESVRNRVLAAGVNPELIDSNTRIKLFDPDASDLSEELLIKGLGSHAPRVTFSSPITVGRHTSSEYIVYDEGPWLYGHGTVWPLLENGNYYSLLEDEREIFAELLRDRVTGLNDMSLELQIPQTTEN